MAAADDCNAKEEGFFNRGITRFELTGNRYSFKTEKLCNYGFETPVNLVGNMTNENRKLIMTEFSKFIKDLYDGDDAKKLEGLATFPNIDVSHYPDLNALFVVIGNANYGIFYPKKSFYIVYVAILNGVIKSDCLSYVYDTADHIYMHVNKFIMYDDRFIIFVANSVIKRNAAGAAGISENYVLIAHDISASNEYRYETNKYDDADNMPERLLDDYNI